VCVRACVSVSEPDPHWILVFGICSMLTFVSHSSPPSPPLPHLFRSSRFRPLAFSSPPSLGSSLPSSFLMHIDSRVVHRVGPLILNPKP
jgi:hypothetical protein